MELQFGRLHELQPRFVDQCGCTQSRLRTGGLHRRCYPAQLFVRDAEQIVQHLLACPIELWSGIQGCIVDSTKGSGTRLPTRLAAPQKERWAELSPWSPIRDLLQRTLSHKNQEVASARSRHSDTPGSSFASQNSTFEWTPAQVKAFRLMIDRSVTWAEWDEKLLSGDDIAAREEFKRNAQSSYRSGSNRFRSAGEVFEHRIATDNARYQAVSTNDPGLSCPRLGSGG